MREYNAPWNSNMCLTYLVASEKNKKKKKKEVVRILIVNLFLPRISFIHQNSEIFKSSIIFPSFKLIPTCNLC